MSTHSFIEPIEEKIKRLPSTLESYAKYIREHDRLPDSGLPGILTLSAEVVKERDQLRAENATLTDWKQSALSVLDGIKLQAIGRALGCGLGEDIGPKILPGIAALQAKVEQMRKFIESTDCGRHCCNGKTYMVFGYETSSGASTTECKPCEICEAKRQALSATPAPTPPPTP